MTHEAGTMGGSLDAFVAQLFFGQEVAMRGTGFPTLNLVGKLQPFLQPYGQKMGRFVII